MSLHPVLTGRRIVLALGFVKGLIDIWSTKSPDNLLYWFILTAIGVVMTLLADKSLRLLDEYSEKLSAVLTIIIVGSVFAFSLLSVTIGLLLFSTSVIGSNTIYNQWFGPAIHEQLEHKHFSSRRNRIPLLSAASLFSRRHGPYALYPLSRCLLA
jgi:asparagine N-glycosylation enzyme membrane subunit Stt3